MLNKKSLSRAFLFLILGIFVFYYITPLYVMIVTSLKTMNEIRDGNLFSFPNAIKLPVSVSVPMKIDKMIVVTKKVDWSAVPYLKKYSAVATSAEAPPPNPLKIATI